MLPIVPIIYLIKSQSLKIPMGLLQSLIFILEIYSRLVFYWVEIDQLVNHHV